MKLPLSSHKEELANTRETLARAEKHLIYAQANVTRLQANVDLYERQIAEAERRGMDAFDDERLYVTRPVQVEAIQYIGTNYDEIASLCGANHEIKLLNPRNGELGIYGPMNQAGIRTTLCTLSIGGWVVKSPDGHIKRMSVREFEATYCPYPKRENDLMAKLRIACEALAALEQHCHNTPASRQRRWNLYKETDDSRSIRPVITWFLVS